MQAASFVTVLGINFINEPLNQCFMTMDESGGLLTVPSGPGLATIKDATVYYYSVRNSDYVIADSGYMVLIWNLISHQKLLRISGLAFIEFFLKHADKTKKILLINPNEKEAEANKSLIIRKGFKENSIKGYLAPFYGKNRPIKDKSLLAIIETFDPAYILINIGGNTQEILGAYLRNHLTSRPLIICTGAAIAFKTGEQVSIPVWVDRLYLGWLWRCVSSPRQYIPRYLSAFKLIYYIFKFGSNPINK